MQELTYPFQIGNQIIEASIQAYTGDFVIPKDQTSAPVKLANNREYLDQRIAGTNKFLAIGNARP